MTMTNRGSDLQTPPAGISPQTHRYYRGVIVPAVAAYCGYESHAEAHRAIKAGFYEMHPDSPSLPSMAGMSREEATRYIDYALRQAAEMQLVISDPVIR